MSDDSDQPPAGAVSPEQITALLPIADEKQRRRCLLLCLRKVRWYLAMRELDTQTLESPKTSRAELAKFARQAQKLRATRRQAAANYEAISAIPTQAKRLIPSNSGHTGRAFSRSFMPGRITSRAVNVELCRSQTVVITSQAIEP